MKFYIASKTRHASAWHDLRVLLEAQDDELTSRWIDEAGEGETDDYARLWLWCIDDIARSDAVIAYYEGGDQWKGAYIEIGAALATGKEVLLVTQSEVPGTWFHHPLVSQYDTIMGAVESFKC